MQRARQGNLIVSPLAYATTKYVTRMSQKEAKNPFPGPLPRRRLSEHPLCNLKPLVALVAVNR